MGVGREFGGAFYQYTTAGFDFAFIHIREPLKGVGREMAAMSTQQPIHTDF
jgi:hypothetical protein